MTVTSTETVGWTAIGAQDAAQRTYASIKQALRAHPNLTEDKVEIFLQGSYANDTNVKVDSDIDVVVMLPNTFASDTTRLTSIEKQSYDLSWVPAVYTSQDLRRDIEQALNTFYRGYVEPKNKCIRVNKRDGYLDADVVPAIQHRLYHKFTNSLDYFTEGTALYPKNGGMTINYPKEHKKNGTTKNKVCNELFKPTVRQLKNLKRHAVNQGLIDPKNAPGYLLECLVYNAPPQLFATHDHVRLGYIMTWLNRSDIDFTGFSSVDGIHTLFGSDPGKYSVVVAKNILYLLNSQVDWNI